MKTIVNNEYIQVLLYNSVQYTMVYSHVASNSVLFAESGDTTSVSAVRQQGEVTVRLCSISLGRRYKFQAYAW